MRDGNEKDMELFADALDVCVANLIEVDRMDELGDGTLYSNMLVKLSDDMLTNYQRWLDDKQKEGSVLVLREWVIRESDFLTVTAETKRGLNPSKAHATTMFSLVDKHSPQERRPMKSTNVRYCCVVCYQNHAVWSCETFRAKTVSERWSTAKQNRLCFKCLGKNHIARFCRRQMLCGIGGCTKTHNRLLHSENEEKPKCKRYSYKSDQTPMPLADSAALRTIPVILKHGSRRIKVNALLDDASTNTYIDSNVAAELGVQGHMQRVNVSVLNGDVKEMETMPVDIGLESIDGKTDIQMHAYTSGSVTGDLKVIDWRQYAGQWSHLEDIDFPSTGSGHTIGMLIGLDHADLHYSYKDVRGKKGDPIARRTPLGWTCISVPSSGDRYLTSNFVRTYPRKY